MQFVPNPPYTILLIFSRFLKFPSPACLIAARRWHTSWPVCLGRADGCQTEQKWLWAQLYPSTVLAQAGGWGSVCLLVLQAEGLGALMIAKEKGFFDMAYPIITQPLEYSTTQSWLEI